MIKGDLYFSTDLIRFISAIEASGNGTVSFNRVGESTPFTSDFYSPVYAVTPLGMQALQDIQKGEIKEGSFSLEKEDLPELLKSTNLSSENKEIYTLCRIVILDAFALQYYYQHEPVRLRYTSKRHVLTVRENIWYLLDYFSHHYDYHFLISRFRHLDTSLGYMENQVQRVAERGGRGFYARI